MLSVWILLIVLDVIPVELKENCAGTKKKKYFTTKKKKKVHVKKIISWLTVRIFINHIQRQIQNPVQHLR